MIQILEQHQVRGLVGREVHGTVPNGKKNHEKIAPLGKPWMLPMVGFMTQLFTFILAH